MADNKIATYAGIIKDLKARKFAPVYYLMGDEPYYIDKITDYIAENVLRPEERDFNQTVMFGSDVSIGQVVDAAKRASAYKVIAVIPYFGWARQDRKDRPRVSIGAKLVANLLMSAGVDRIITMDLHADQIQGFFDVPLDHIYASRIFVPYIESLGLENLSVATPDIGGAKRANSYASYFNAPLVICHKHRNKPNEVAKMMAIGEVKDRNIILLDDMIDTGGTITKAANMFMDMGARSVRAVATHAVLSGSAYEKLAESKLSEVIVTDTIPLRTDKDTSKITVLSTADVFADVIERVHNYKEISSQFVFVKK